MAGQGNKKRWRKRIAAYAATAAAVVAATAAVAGVALGLAQLERANALQEENNQLRRAELDSHFEEVMMGLDRHFVVHPSLRRFFYSPGARSLPFREPLRAQALGTAELVIDFADDVGAYVRMQEMARPSQERWTQIVRSYFAESPVVRFVWWKFHGAYDESTACVLGAPYSADELLGWRWQLNAPLAQWPEICK